MRSSSLLLALSLFPLSLPAQGASPYVPLQHWAMPYVEHLIAAGKLVDPTPLTRPLRRGDVVRGLEAMDTLRLSGGERRVVRALLADFRRRGASPPGPLSVPARGNETHPSSPSPEGRGDPKGLPNGRRGEVPNGRRGVAQTPKGSGGSGEAWARLDADLGVTGATHALRDPLEIDRGLPPRSGATSRGFVNGGLSLQLGFGPLVAVTHPYFDTQLKFDPDWYGKKDRTIAGRTAESYISAQWRWAELFYGRLDRNWGPSGVPGVLLSDDPYGLDHFGLTLGTSGVQLQALVTQLDTRPDTAGVAIRRYMVLHRLWLRPRGRWTVTLWEGAVLSGADRTIEPWYLNILNLAVLEQVNSGTNVNSFLGVDFERRGGVTLFGQLMLDDIQVDRRTLTDQKPVSYAATLGAKGRFPFPGAWTLWYTQVANLTYRNEDDLQVPLYHGLGTGRNFSDYDQATARISLIAPGGVLLEPEVTLVRQGEGDPRLPHPLPAAYPATATLFEGVVQRTLRLALGAQWSAGPLHWSANGGVHATTNDGHVQGQSRTRFVGSMSVSWRFRGEGALP
ncbi:MAG: hypothetical protein ACREMW_16140 [Gemmatimonadales bacterium]